MAATVIEHPEAKREALLRAARNGSDDAFAELIRLHESMVFSIALHTLRDRGVAEELAQEVFLQLYRNLLSMQSASHLLFWLRRTTTNRCIDELRKRKDVVGLELIEGESVMEEQHDHFLNDRLKNLVGSLPDQQRMAVVMRYQEGMDPAEISTALGVPVNTIKSHLRRALATLRIHLGLAAEAPHDPELPQMRSGS